ncbi:6-bladed beta-propeller [Paraprevotella clara]|uniref:6-bladed beta-propeller n=2 Tax=Paraprevotella clara TaxID=454154 RepID=UPI003AB83DF9
MRSIIPFVYIIFISLFMSCTNKDKTDIQSIKMDFSKTTHINQTDGRIVNLETTERSLLYDICNFNVYKDTFVVHSRNFLYTFDSSGKFIGSISQKGHAGNEYIQISNVFFKNDTVGLYDFGKNAILQFNLKGHLLSVQRCDITEEDIKPFHIYPWNNGYIVLNSYGGESTDRKTLCFLNKELTSGKPIKGRSLSTGFSTYDDISINQKGNVLYWEMLCDTLFTIHNDLLTPLFAIDFGEHALPDDITRKDVYERINYVNKSKEKGKQFAGMARYYQRIDNMIYFSCVSPNNEILLCQYNEDKGTTRLFTIDFDNKQYTTAPFFLIKDHLVYWEIRNKDDLLLNPGLFIFNLNYLK